MSSVSRGFSLTQAFVEFHLELKRQREAVASGKVAELGSEAGDCASASATGGSSCDPADALEALFARQYEAARKAGRGEDLREAQYAMAVRADEVFTSMAWPGRDAWRDRLLQQRLFDSEREVDGGERVYQRIDELLLEPAGSRGEMGKVYLLLLSLGFRGRFVGDEETTHIDAYRRDLYKWIYGRPANEAPSAERLMPQAYENTIDHGERTLMRSLWGWFIALAAALLVLLAASQMIWTKGTSDVKETLERIGKAG